MKPTKIPPDFNFYVSSFLQPHYVPFSEKIFYFFRGQVVKTSFCMRGPLGVWVGVLLRKTLGGVRGSGGMGTLPGIKTLVPRWTTWTKFFLHGYILGRNQIPIQILIFHFTFPSKIIPITFDLRIVKGRGMPPIWKPLTLSFSIHGKYVS